MQNIMNYYSILIFYVKLFTNALIDLRLESYF